MKKTVVDVAENLPTHVIDGDNILPLTHTVSFYRKQTQTSTTPIKQICRQPLEEEASEVCSEDQELIKVKMAQLKNEVTKQEMIISQTSQALNLCNSTPEFMGSTEQVEAERVLLLSSNYYRCHYFGVALTHLFTAHRRQAALHELQRLEVEKTLRPQRQTSERLPLQKGTLTLSKIVLPLKQKYVTALAAAGGKGHHVVCLVKYADQVLPTPLVSTIASNSKNPELELCIPGVVTLENIYNDSTVTFEVYCLQAQEEVLPHEIKYHIKKVVYFVLLFSLSK
jgi:actin-binding protein anillin